MNHEDCSITQQRTSDPVCDSKACCYYCSDPIDDINEAKTIHDTTDNIKNIVCSYDCMGIPDEMKDNCSNCGKLFFDESHVCISCSSWEEYDRKFNEWVCDEIAYMNQ
jgi:hypothetical protein